MSRWTAGSANGNPDGGMSDAVRAIVSSPLRYGPPAPAAPPNPDEAIEAAYWSFDAERSRTGAERDAFKRQLRKLSAEVANLRIAIQRHRNYWEDRTANPEDDALYAALDESRDRWPPSAG